MAGRKSAYRFFAMENETANGGFASDEFDESDVWGCAIETRPSATGAVAESTRGRPIPPSRSGRKKDRVTAAAASLPVNIPDWSKILKEEYRGNGNNSYSNKARIFDFDDDEDLVTGGAVIPPHELLCRNRAASFSVQEGIGRTLKGRDLSRVRNAIFEKTGFED